MKLYYLIFLVLFATFLNAQNVGINETGNAPNPNAILDVDADSNNDKGILIPRLTTAQRTGIAGLGAGDEGLMVYDETTNGFWFWDGSQWVEFSSGSNFNQEISNNQSATTDPDGFTGCVPVTHSALPNLRIPPGSATSGTTTYNFPITQSGNICDINVVLDITHTYDWDLTITITSPAGTSVLLTSDNGGSGNNYQITTFDDEASTAVTAGSAPFNGSYRPEGNLSDFDGEAATGVWVITIVDGASGDIGWFNTVDLVISTNASSTWNYIGQASITYKTGSTPVISAYYSSNPIYDFGCKIRVTRSTISGAGTVGTVLSYSAQSAYSGNNNYWVSMSSIIEDDAALTDGTIYYYKLWRAGDIEAGKENYSIIPVLIDE